MYKFDRAAGQVIATDTQTSVAAIDQAVLSYSRLCSSIIEVSNSSNLPITTAQKALKSAAVGLNALVDGRESMAMTTRELLKIQAESSLKTFAIGCPNGLPTGAEHKTVELLKQRA